MRDPAEPGRLTALDVLAASLADMPGEDTGSYHVCADTAVIKPPAVFDTDAAKLVRDLTIRLQDNSVTTIVFDLAGVTAVDNAVLGVIHGAHKRLRSAGGGAAVAAPPPAIACLFQAAGLDQHVPVRAAAAKAARAARARPQDTDQLNDDQNGGTQ
jgi:anti-anti-sigma factor